MKGLLKFFLKVKIVAPLRLFFLCFTGTPAVEMGRGRVLIINLLGLGDLILFTSVLKHYRKAFPGKKIYLLVKLGIGVEKLFAPAFVDEIISVDYRKFASNPIYGARFINDLRKIGFGKAIDHSFSAAEILGKMIAVEAGAEEVVGYEGVGLEWREPFDFQQKKNLEIVKSKIFPRYTKVIPSIDSGVRPKDRMISAVKHYVATYEGTVGKKEQDYATFLPDVEGSGSFGLERGKYAVFNVSASVPYKRWPLFRFSKMAEFLAEKGLKIVVVGAKNDKSIADEFSKVYFPGAINLAGKTSLGELVVLVRDSLLVFTNDTSLVHIAVALKKPLICVTGGGHFGMFSHYGYPDINKWVWRKSPCYFDSWHCGRSLPDYKPSPCLEAVPLSYAFKEVGELLDYIKRGEETKDVFRADFTQEEFFAAKGNKIKVLYSGIRNENYNPKKPFGFEYNNFYLTLKQMPNVEVIEYPYDPITNIGKKRWNAELLSFVKSEKPDLFFAFMYTDEFDTTTLKEIKNLTKSIAWFADDYWRFFNYSRRWPPYFTHVVTTYSRAVDWYKKSGASNVILSQWGCDTNVYKPLDIKKDIDVSFVGQNKSGRVKVIEAIRRSGIDVQCFGFGWPGGKVSQAEMIKVFSRSKICLNLTDRKSLLDFSVIARIFLKKSFRGVVPDVNIFDNIRAYLRFQVLHTHARPFELAGCGAFVISGWSEDIGKFYKENEEMVFYRNPDELPEKIKYYLAHDDERERIARAGYERTIKEHTYKKRFSEIFFKIGLKF